MSAYIWALIAPSVGPCLAAREPARCTAVATLREIVDGRKLRFDVEVRDGERVIGVGTHERRAVPGLVEREADRP